MKKFSEYLDETKLDEEVKFSTIDKKIMDAMGKTTAANKMVKILSDLVDKINKRTKE